MAGKLALLTPGTSATAKKRSAMYWAVVRNPYPTKESDSLVLSSCGIWHDNMSARSMCCSAPESRKHCVMMGS